jgi:hypothetical protein
VQSASIVQVVTLPVHTSFWHCSPGSHSLLAVQRTQTPASMSQMGADTCGQSAFVWHPAPSVWQTPWMQICVSLQALLSVQGAWQQPVSVLHCCDGQSLSRWQTESVPQLAGGGCWQVPEAQIPPSEQSLFAWQVSPTGCFALVEQPATDIASAEQVSRDRSRRGQSRIGGSLDRDIRLAAGGEVPTTVEGASGRRQVGQTASFRLYLGCRDPIFSRRFHAARDGETSFAG